jgi:hypothetical protein
MLINRAASFDYLVGDREKRWGYVDAQGLGGSDIDGQFDLRGLLHWKISSLLTFEDAINVTGCAPKLVNDIGSVGDQSAASSRGQPHDEFARQLAYDEDGGVLLDGNGDIVRAR